MLSYRLVESSNSFMCGAFYFYRCSSLPRSLSYAQVAEVANSCKEFYISAEEVGPGEDLLCALFSEQSDPEVWISIRPKAIYVVNPEGMECQQTYYTLPDYLISELIWFCTFLRPLNQN